MGIITQSMPNPTATFDSSAGTFQAEIYLDQMPLTASNFIDLANSGFYDGVHFHRVIAQFMNQFGCPHAKQHGHPRAGTGGPAPGSKFMCNGAEVVRGNDGQGGGTIKDEHTAKISNEPGTLSMANAGPNTGGSQFFINTVHNDFLDWFRNDLGESQHPVFGKVTSGMDVVMKINNSPCDRNDLPKTPIMMKSIRVA